MRDHSSHLRDYDTEHLPEPFELDASERLRHEVSRHVVGVAVYQLNVARRNCLSNEVEMNINMFGTGVECWIRRELDRSLVIAVEDGGLEWFDVGGEAGNGKDV